MRHAILLLVIFLGRAATAVTPWEVAVIFLGSGEPVEYQQDMDRNVVELARLRPGPLLKLSIYREFSDRAVQMFVDPTSSRLHPWDPLFFKVSPSIEIAGEMSTWSRDPAEASLLAEGDRLKAFVRSAFVSGSARRLLVLHGHGLGFDGMKSAALRELSENLRQALDRPLDILWLDSCYMASLEALYEMEPVAKRVMASEDSEFSSGAPFESLGDFLESGPDEAGPVATKLADRFLESYSFVKHGSQTSAVYRSSATISVIELSLLRGLIPEMRALTATLKQRLSDEWKGRLTRRIRKIQMERSDIVDLGSLLLELKDLSIVVAKPLIETLEVGRRGKLKTNPRIRAEAPKQDSQLVWGYENWTRGWEGDDDVIEKLPSNLTPAGFESGPNEKSWPYRNVVKRLYLAPFTVGLNAFHFFFIDPEGNRGPVKSYRRFTDMVSFEASRPENPVRFSGYTQGVGMTAERYSGLSVATPLIGIPNLSYMDTRFYTDTRWTDF